MGVTHRGRLAPPQQPRPGSGGHIAATWVMHHRLCSSRRDKWGFMQAHNGSIAATRPSSGRDHGDHMLPASFCALPVY
eukprot:2141352-Prymnesium_polylepis.1